MRIASHFLALLLTITSIVTPCLANAQVSHASNDAQIALSETVVVAKSDDSSCKGPCIKAILSRQADFEKVAILQSATGDDVIGNSTGPLWHPPVRLVKNIGRLRSPCTNSVNLHMLCRQLN